MHWFSGKALLAGLCVIGAAVQIGWICYPSLVKSPKVTPKSGMQRPITSEAADQPSGTNPPAAESTPAVSVDSPMSELASQPDSSSDVSSDVSSEGELSESGVAELLHRVGVQIILRETRGTGSGVIVAQSPDGFDVLTACHVVQNHHDLTVVFWRSIGDNLHREESRAVEVVACDVKRDLARLRVTSPIVPSSALAPMEADPEHALPSDGRQVWGMAWSSRSEPQARPLRITEVKTVARQADSGLATYWVVDSASDSGMSGGPLLDIHGHLIGVASGNSSGSGYYVHLSEVLEFMVGS